MKVEVSILSQRQGFSNAGGTAVVSGHLTLAAKSFETTIRDNHTYPLPVKVAV
jgi:hypothetical protein